MNNFMQQNTYYNYKKGINELKKLQNLFQMVLEFINLLGCHNEPLVCRKSQKSLKKEFLHI